MGVGGFYVKSMVHGVGSAALGPSRGWGLVCPHQGDGGTECIASWSVSDLCPLGPTEGDTEFLTFQPGGAVARAWEGACSAAG